MNYLSYLLVGSLCLAASQCFAMHGDDNDIQEVLGGFHKLKLEDAYKDEKTQENKIKREDAPDDSSNDQGASKEEETKDNCTGSSVSNSNNRATNKDEKTTESSSRIVPQSGLEALYQQRLQEVETWFPDYPYHCVDAPFDVQDANLRYY